MPRRKIRSIKTSVCRHSKNKSYSCWTGVAEVVEIFANLARIKIALPKLVHVREPSVVVAPLVVLKELHPMNVAAVVPPTVA